MYSWTLDVNIEAVYYDFSLLIIIIIKDIYIAQVRKGHKCAMSAEMAVWLLHSCTTRSMLGPVTDYWEGVISPLLTLGVS